MFAAKLLLRAEALLDLCRAQGLKIATAESCTGGLVAALLTEIAGSSDVVERGFVTYSNAAKQECLGVSPETLAAHGAVSAPTAREMAEGALAHSYADLAVSITGIAGPGGGSAEKPVGLVHFACARRGGGTEAVERRFGDLGRGEVRQGSVAQALAMLEAALAQTGGWAHFQTGDDGMNALLKSMSLDEFLAWEERQELKWEYDGFATRAMTGGTSAHALIQANLVAHVHFGLRGSPCRIYGPELKVRTQSTIRYPDALVVCSKIDARSTFTTDASVVFEILSKSSAVFDLGVKSVEYRTLPSLKRYVVLHQTVAAAEVFQIDAEGAWTYDFITASGALDMPEIGCAVALTDVYAGVEFPT